MRASLLLFLLGACLVRPVSAETPALINIKDIAPGIVLDLRYATPHNFTGATLYDSAECHLAEPAAKRLARVQKNLEKKGLGLKVWDCYRPLSVQKKLWDRVPDPRYVANPATGSRHNRGASVDLTLVDKTGKELPMPTGFDEFSEKAHRDFADLPADVIENRATLREAMEAEGFIGLPTEWWHFDDPEWQNYSLRDDSVGAKSLEIEKMSSPSPFIIAPEVSQLIVVLSDGWDATTGVLQRWEKGRSWQKAGEPWKVSLGLNGMGWGQGLHPYQEGPQKREGDNKAPAGVFKIGAAYGYAPTAPSGSAWPYQQVDESWRCIDDPTSASYNQILKTGPAAKSDWKRAEQMKRPDHLYKWVINVEQNFPHVVAGCGSCIFLHVWREEGAGTEGCTAMPEDRMVALLRWLKDNRPLLVQLPKSEYEKFKETWKLP